MSVRIEFLTDEAEIRQVLPDWKRLHAETGLSPFSSAEWIDAWLNAWPCAERRPLFLCAWQGDRLVAGWPLGLSRDQLIRYGPKDNCLRPLCDDKAGFHELLVSEDAKPQIPAMLRALQKAASWRVLDLTPMWPTPTFEEVMRCASQQGLRVRLREEIRTPLADLRNGWDEYLATRSREFRKSLRSGHRKLAALDHRFHSEYVSVEGGRSVLDKMFLLAERGWKARLGTDLSTNAELRQFVESLWERMAPEGTIGLHLLEIGGTGAASCLTIDCGRTRFGLVKDFDERFARLSPGRLLTSAVMEDAANRGVQTFDLLRTTPFTSRFSSETAPLYRARIVRRFGAVDMLLALEDLLRPIGKAARRRRKMMTRKRASNRSGALTGMAENDGS